jgi:hypothetical protein
MLLIALLGIYMGHLGYRLFLTYHKRKWLKPGDYCSVYLGERKISALVLRVNHEVDVWILNMIIRFSKKEIYS